MAAPFVKLPDPARESIEGFLSVRPNVELPSHLSELEGTHGVYVGDGAPLREIVLGWKPAFVVFIVPGWPDGPPQPTKDGGYARPPLHAQPQYTPRGFKVGKVFNGPGELAMYVAWKAT